MPHICNSPHMQFSSLQCLTYSAMFSLRYIKQSLTDIKVLIKFLAVACLFGAVAGITLHAISTALNGMLGLNDEPPEEEADDEPSSVRRKRDAVMEHERLIRDAWHRNAVSMAFAPREPTYAGKMALHSRHTTPTILEEDSSLASE
jgi:hypothetical protein